MTKCICGHEERHHDNQASRCDKFGCYCEIFRPDWAMLEAQYNDLHTACTAEIAALTAERDAARRQFELAVSRVVLIEQQRDTLLLFVNGKISRAEMEASLSEMEGVTLK
jgi:hypothetical protein